MAQIDINTSRRVIPMIYAYSTPEIKRHDGWVKIGYTEKQTTSERQYQQSHTVDVELKEEWKGNAIFDDGSGEIFHDTDFQAYLRKQGIENKKGTEWFHIDGPASHKEFNDFRSNRGILKALDSIRPYTLRDEQQKAVNDTVAYASEHEGGEYLWNAKPRFGKTLTVYDFCIRMNAKNVLIITNRPAIANSWYSDYVEYLGDKSGYKFVSRVDALSEKPYCISRQEYLDCIKTGKTYGCIEFVSLQDLKGSLHFGGEFDKLEEVANLFWDVLVIDEAHEGVDTYKTDVALNRIKRKFTIHLSGTPFKALANEKFPADAIFNWTYADEQEAKENWNGENENPYITLPKLNLYTYQMSKIIKDELVQGIEIQGETEEYAFDLSEFFAVRSGKFAHESSVDKFLEALTTQEKFPFSTEELRNELKHTFWILNHVNSAKLLAKKLREHKVFKDYEIIVAAGDGIVDEEDESEKSFDKVTKAIAEHEKTITLSVGQLTTGITIPEWSGVLMLSNIKSPSLYMQAAFRSQNPCLFSENGQFFRKENAYVFDFDPARTLIIYESFANDLCGKGKLDSESRKENIKTLLNFFPVIGEDEEGRMVKLDAEKVLSIPRKIKSEEVVKRGFMSDFLFQNISNIFHAPQEVIDMITSFPSAKQGTEVTPQTKDELFIDENGEVSLDDEYVIGKETEVFGDKIYDIAQEEVESAILSDEEVQIENIKEALKKGAINPIIETAKEQYGSKMPFKKIEADLSKKADDFVSKQTAEYSIRQKELENDFSKQIDFCDTREQREQLKNQFEQKKKEASNDFITNLVDSVKEFVDTAQKETTTTIEKKIKEKDKQTIEDMIRCHLRGFSRTIPSFLMAYGDENVTLETFDKVIPDEVFMDVTSISIAQFIFLRDGGEYTDDKTGEKKWFDGHLFDQVVFDDSVKEFLSLKKSLANYFDEESTEDIFDYIPPQRTNQIFTPKWVVKRMIEMLEEENEGCFDDPDKTFIDLYMKSGLYITEIVKRLYQSEHMKELFPQKEERLEHIFENQVYGLAPTEIIYRIATNYILGFDDTSFIKRHNFKQVDTLPYAKEGTLDEFLDTLYGGGENGKA